MALGLSPEAHRKRSKTARERTFKHIRDARKNLETGACRSAIDNLVLAAASHGMASAEYEAATKTARFPITRKAVEALRRDVKRVCTCSKRKKR